MGGLVTKGLFHTRYVTTFENEHHCHKCRLIIYKSAYPRTCVQTSCNVYTRLTNAFRNAVNVQLLPSGGQGLAKLSSHLSNDAKPVNETYQHSVNSHCILQSCPNYRGRKVAMDIILPTQRKDCLVIIDYYSRWIEIKQLTSLTSACVISRVKAVVITHGFPDVVVSDNGRQFVSDELKRFADEMCFTQQTTNPYFARENGMAERAVQTAEQLLDLEGPEMCLLNYRASSHSAIVFHRQWLRWGTYWPHKCRSSTSN